MLHSNKQNVCLEAYYVDLLCHVKKGTEAICPEDNFSHGVSQRSMNTKKYEYFKEVYLVVGHRLEIIIDHPLTSVAAADVIFRL